MNKRYTSGPKLKELLIACNDQLSNGKIKIMLTIREFGKKASRDAYVLFRKCIVHTWLRKWNE